MSIRIVVLILCSLSVLVAPAVKAAGTGFVVAAPDRGFLGNEEIRDQFARFEQAQPARLILATDERTDETFRQAVQSLKDDGVDEVVILPFFLSRAEARFRRLEHAALAAPMMPIRWAQPWGETYLAVEALARRLSAHGHATAARLVVAGAAASAEVIAADLRRIAEAAIAGTAFEHVDAAVWPEYKVPQADAIEAAAEQTLAAAGDATVIPVHLGKRLDGMMALSLAQQRALPDGTDWIDEAPIGPLVLTWMQREANRALPWQGGADGDIGVIIAAHGSDWHWNETMRQAVAPLAKHYRLAFAFSMADPPIVERAVRRLESQGARAIVIVRVFGLEDSFRSSFLKMSGQDIEQAVGDGAIAATEHAQGHFPAGKQAAHTPAANHGGHGASSGSGRIPSTAVILTAGGLGDSPLFARALLERARALSADPSRETVILVAHGTKDDARNARWLDVLERIAAQMRQTDGDPFRAIRVATWREDWPDKRAEWVPRVREWVEVAARAGTAIVIPARTNGTGPEARLLEGLDYRLGNGFAPHSLFAEWVDTQVRDALSDAKIHRVSGDDDDKDTHPAEHKVKLSSASKL